LLRASGKVEGVAALAGSVCRADQIDSTALELAIKRAVQIPKGRIAPPPLVTGDDLIALGVPPGPVYTRVLDAIYRGQQNEELNERSEALDMARRMLGESD
jgi:hypothetical protein